MKSTYSELSNVQREKIRERSRTRCKDRAKHQRKIVNDAKSRPCLDCGLSYPPWVMDFDHRPEAVKAFNIGSWVGSVNDSLLREEIGKCDVVCANCHRRRTHDRNAVVS